MKKALSRFKGKLLKLYTISGVEAYIGTLEQVEGDDYVVLRDQNKGDEMFICMKTIESFKALPEHGAMHASQAEQAV